MQAPTIESLISKGTKYEKVNGKTMFYVTDIKKEFPNAKIKKTDIVTHEVGKEGEDKKAHKFVDFANVKF